MERNMDDCVKQLISNVFTEIEEDILFTAKSLTAEILREVQIEEEAKQREQALVTTSRSLIGAVYKSIEKDMIQMMISESNIGRLVPIEDFCFKLKPLCI